MNVLGKFLVVTRSQKKSSGWPQITEMTGIVIILVVTTVFLFFLGGGAGQDLLNIFRVTSYSQPVTNPIN